MDDEPERVLEWERGAAAAGVEIVAKWSGEDDDAMEEAGVTARRS
jgi:hypothetical protein